MERKIKINICGPEGINNTNSAVQGTAMYANNKKVNMKNYSSHKIINFKKLRKKLFFQGSALQSYGRKLHTQSLIYTHKKIKS